METIQQEPIIKCDFTPPEISLEAFRSHKTNETLADSLSHNPIVSALFEAYGRPDDVTTEYLRQLEQDAIRASAELLRECQQYLPGNKPWEEKSKGDCYSYTWLMSDITERLQMKSMIAYCNGHAFNIIQGQSGELHMINGESKHMWLHDLENNFTAQDAFSEDVLTNIKELGENESLACSLRTESMRYYSDKHQALGKLVVLPWLEASVPATKIMTAPEGKKALFAYSCYEQAIRNGSFAEIRMTLMNMSNCNPQVETRERINPELKEFKKQVKRWALCEDIDEEEIVEVIEAYRAMMPETKSMVIFAGDCLRSVGKAKNSVNSLEEADETYAQAKKRFTRKRDLTLEGKRKKVQELLSKEKELIGAAA